MDYIHYLLVPFVPLAPLLSNGGSHLSLQYVFLVLSSFTLKLLYLIWLQSCHLLLLSQ